mgnify:CR=1 FL=1
MPINHKYKLLSIRTRLLKNEIEIIDETIQTAEKEFILELRKAHTVKQEPEQQESKQEKKHTPAEEKPQVNCENNTEETLVSSADKGKPAESMKKTYRKIAFLAHPDKLLGFSDYESSHKKLLFEKAKKALEENDYCAIIEIASELGIEPPVLSKADVEIIKKNIKKLEKKIKTKKESIAWVWYHSEEEKRKTIMDRYIEELKKLNPRA